MITVSTIQIIIAIVCIFILGIAVGRMIFPKKDEIEPCGILHVEMSDPDENYLFLELDKAHSPERIAEEEYVIFYVDNKSYLTPNEQREIRNLSPRK